MSENKPAKPNNNYSNEHIDNDMDLIDLIRLCWRWFVKYIFKPLEFLFRFGLRNWWKLGIIAIATFALSVIVNLWIWPTYVMTVKLNNRYASAQYYIDEINNLKTDKRTIYEIFGIDKDSIKYLSGIKGHYAVYTDSTSHNLSMMDEDDKYINGKKNAKYGIANDMFYVQIKAKKHKSLLYGMDSALVNYLSNTDYIQTAIRLLYPQLTKQIATYSDEASKLDSLRQKIYFSNATILTSGVAVQTPQTQLLTDQILNVNTHLASLQSDLSMINKVLVFLTRTKIETEYSIVNDGLRHTAIAIAVGFILLLCWQYRKKISDYVNS